MTKRRPLRSLVLLRALRVELAPAPRRRAGRDVFVYFDNDAKVHPPFDAIRLAERLA